MMRYFKPARRLATATLLTLLGALAGCSLAPPYAPPHMVLPASYKGTGPFALAHPEDQLAQSDWWKMFGDEQLDRLEASLNAANPDLQAAEETYTQARDIVGEARSQLLLVVKFLMTCSGLIENVPKSVRNCVAIWVISAPESL